MSEVERLRLQAIAEVPGVVVSLAGADEGIGAVRAVEELAGGVVGLVLGDDSPKYATESHFMFPRDCAIPCLATSFRSCTSNETHERQELEIA